MRCIQFLIANYNSIEHIEILTKSLRAFHPGFSYELLVCDNGSKDGSAEYLESLPEVRLWRLEDRAADDQFVKRQQTVIDKYGLEPYMNDYFRRKTVWRDYRQTHNAALNFLVSKVTSPIFATLDTDIEFLGPHWIEPFLLPFLLDPTVGCVGLEERVINFKVGKFQGRTVRRIHPCLALWRTSHVWNVQSTWDIDDEFELRFLLMQKSIQESVDYNIQLGDTGYRITRDLEEGGSKVVSLPPEDFFRSCRHFYGTTCEKVYFNKDYKEWINSISTDPKLKPLVDFTELSQQYSKFSRDALHNCRRHWQEHDPELPMQPEVPLVFVD